MMHEVKYWKGPSSEFFVSELQQCISKVNPGLICRSVSHQKSDAWIDQNQVMELLHISNGLEFRKLMPKAKKLGLITYEHQYIERYFKPSVEMVREKMCSK